MYATDGKSQTLFLLRARGSRRLESALVFASILFALAIGAFLLWRRVAGAILGPMPMMQLLGTAFGITSCLVVLRLVRAKPQAVTVAMVCVLFVFAVACSYPGNRILDWVVWCSAGAIVYWAPVAVRSEKRSLVRRNSVVNDGGESCDRMLQQYSRVRSSDGRETISGSLVAEFAAGERQTTVYAGFCPPFELLPLVEANAGEEFEAQVKLVQVLHNGAQFEVRLEEAPEEPFAVMIEFVATEPSAL